MVVTRELEQTVKRIGEAVVGTVAAISEALEQAGVSPDDLERLAERFEREDREAYAQLEAEHDGRVAQLGKRWQRY